jgi:uncharacterized membrane protein YphA (DoxX/SURF4 family)
MKTWLARLEHYWFAPRAEFDVGVFRVLIGIWLFYTWFARLAPRLESSVDRPPELALPPTLIRWSGLPVPVPALVVDVAQWVFPALCMLLVIGLFTRPVLALVTMLFLWFEGSHNSWGYTSHSTILPALLLIILCFAPGVERLSLDARRDPSLSAGTPSGWPIRLALLLIVLLYFASGLSKLRYSGLGWLDGETLAFYLGGGSPRGTGGLQSFIGDPSLPEATRFRDGFGLVDYAWVADPPYFAQRASGVSGLMKWASAPVLLLELAFPLALLGRRWMSVLLVLGAAFHLVVYLLMRIDFMAYLVSYCLFIDWSWLRARALQRPTASA